MRANADFAVRYRDVTFMAAVVSLLIPLRPPHRVYDLAGATSLESPFLRQLRREGNQLVRDGAYSKPPRCIAAALMHRMRNRRRDPLSVFWRTSAASTT